MTAAAFRPASARGATRPSSAPLAAEASSSDAGGTPDRERRRRGRDGAATRPRRTHPRASGSRISWLPSALANRGQPGQSSRGSPSFPQSLAGK